MKTITSLFVWKVIRQVEPASGQFDKAKILRGLGIDPEVSVDPTFRIAAEDYYNFLENLTTIDKNPITLPLRTGASMQCDDYGAFGLAWKTALNLRGCFERAERYGRMLTNVATYQLEETANEALIHLHRNGDRTLGMRLSNEATIASIHSISQQISSEPFTPAAVFFKHAAPETKSEHETHFACPVHFNSDKDALLVSNKMLNLPAKLGDETISRFFESHLEAELSKLENSSTLHKKVKIQISQALNNGIPTISHVAEQLNMSGRTLQRKLSDLGYSYQNLIDESRRELAERLLEQTDYSLADVAFMTGFSEQSAFTRAFKRWAGQTPRSFRIQSQ